MRQLGYDVPSGQGYAEGLAWTSYFSHAPGAVSQQQTFTPIGCLIAYLTRKLAWENHSLRQLADYYPKTGIEGQGAGDVRFWTPPAIYAPEILYQLPERMRGGNWDEWSSYFF